MKKNGLSIHGFTPLNLFLTHHIPNQTKIKHPLNVYKTKHYAKKKKKKLHENKMHHCPKRANLYRVGLYHKLILYNVIKYRINKVL